VGVLEQISPASQIELRGPFGPGLVASPLQHVVAVPPCMHCPIVAPFNVEGMHVPSSVPVTSQKELKAPFPESAPQALNWQ
jgi:hypothetical protein